MNQVSPKCRTGRPLKSSKPAPKGPASAILGLDRVRLVKASLRDAASLRVLARRKANLDEPGAPWTGSSSREYPADAANRGGSSEFALSLDLEFQFIPIH